MHSFFQSYWHPLVVCTHNTVKVSYSAEGAPDGGDASVGFGKACVGECPANDPHCTVLGFGDQFVLEDSNNELCRSSH
jgi:hypothetical protein